VMGAGESYPLTLSGPPLWPTPHATGQQRLPRARPGEAVGFSELAARMGSGSAASVPLELEHGPDVQLRDGDPRSVLRRLDL